MNALTTTTAPMNPALSLLMDVQKFDHLQRVGKMLAMSPLFPEHLRKGGMEAAIANGALVLNMANRLNEDPLTVAQNIFFVGGRPGWNTTYMIAKANQAGVFRDPIDWDIKGKGETLSATAFGVLARTGKRVEVTLDWDTAKKEGWLKNPKYQSIPEQMFRYRTACFLIRLYCPEVMIGLPAQIEQELQSGDMRDVTPDDGPVVMANKEPPIEAKAAPVKEPAKPAAEAATSIKAAQQGADNLTAEAKREPTPAVQTIHSEPAEHWQTSKDEAAKPQVDEEQFRGLLDMMLNDLAQSGADETEQVYAAQVEQMRESAPTCYREWQDALTAARSAG